MQATVVLLIALGGLGCQNPADDLSPIPPVAVQPAAPSPAPVVADGPAPTGYPVYLGGVDRGGDPCDGEPIGNCVHDTFCSFFIGRSPDVPSARQIEAAYPAGAYSR